MYRIFVTVTALSIAISPATAGTIRPQSGWVVIDTRYPFSTLGERLESTVKGQHMGLVTSASASEGAKATSIHIPGNGLWVFFETISRGACWMQVCRPASRRQFASM